jgi:hypothetical protein
LATSVVVGTVVAALAKFAKSLALVIGCPYLISAEISSAVRPRDNNFCSAVPFAARVACCAASSTALRSAKAIASVSR